MNATSEDLDNIPLSQVQGFKQPALPWYADQCLPFDVTIACGNEFGAAASSKLFGVEILNEGFGTSVDDSVLEQQATFIARSVLPLQAVGRSSANTRRVEQYLGMSAGQTQKALARERRDSFSVALVRSGVSQHVAAMEPMTSSGTA